MRRRLIPLLPVVFAACARPNYVAPAGPAALSERAVCATRLGPDCVIVRWERLAFGGESSSFLLKLGRLNLGDGSLIVVDGGADPRVSLVMPDMGHGIRPVTVTRVDVGTYRVSDVHLPHGGLWEIRLSRESEGGREDAALRFTL